MPAATQARARRLQRHHPTVEWRDGGAVVALALAWPWVKAAYFRPACKVTSGSTVAFYASLRSASTYLNCFEDDDDKGPLIVAELGKVGDDGDPLGRGQRLDLAGGSIEMHGDVYKKKASTRKPHLQVRTQGRH